MKFKASDLCKCGHSYFYHTVYGYDGACASYCVLHTGEECDVCRCGRFLLDNLSYIENLAKEKGLV